MKKNLRNLRTLTFSGMVILGSQVALAQSTLIPTPFSSVVAGFPAGGPYVACPTTVDIPQVTGTVHLGDGCPANQANITGYTDMQVDDAGNIYISENGHDDIRVVYKGGSVIRNLIIAANPFVANLNPVIGDMYTVAGGETSALKSANGIYYCGNVNPNGLQALDSSGDGCPAAMSFLIPKGMFVDQYGNIWAASQASGYSMRVIYAGGAQVAKLITLMNPTVKTPQVGYIYNIVAGGAQGVTGDGGLANLALIWSPRTVTVDPAGNVYAALANTSGTLKVGTTTYEINGSNNNVRVTDGTTGIISVLTGASNCFTQPISATDPIGGYDNGTPGCPFVDTYTTPTPLNVYNLPNGDGGPASAGLLNGPYCVFLDTYNNLFILDASNSRVRVVYRGGTLAGIANPVVGNIYTYVGGGATAGVQGTAGLNVKFNQNVVSAGIDQSGNVYVQDTTGVLWKFDKLTAVGTMIAGGTASSGATHAGLFCSGTSGPTSIDNFADGCPGSKNYFAPTGKVAADPQGNLYITRSGGTSIVKLSYNTNFPATALGSTVTQPIAITATAATTLTGLSFTINGAPTAEFSDAGGDTCTTTQVMTAGQICTFYVKFNPAHVGLRTGTVTITSSTPGSNVVEVVCGIGSGGSIAVDPGTTSHIGTSITPGGVATDLLGNVYVADTVGNQVLKGSATGTTLTPVITGLKQPSQVAIDGAGNIYVADTGNNQILETNSAGVTIATLGTGLSAPRGVAIDAAGNIYVADTGNNRIVVLHSNGYQLTLLQAAGLSAPTQLAIDLSNNLYIIDSGNKRLAVYGPGSGVSTYPVDSGAIPVGVALDAAGDVYIEDKDTLNVLEYVVGAPLGTQGAVLVSGLTTPVALASDPDSNLFIADSANAYVTEYRRSLGNVQFPLTNLNTTSSSSMTLSNVGNGALTFTPGLANITGTNAGLFSVASGTSNGCVSTASYAPSTSCNITATFTPGNTAVIATATAAFTSNAGNAATAIFNAQALHLTTTTTALPITPSTVYYSQSVSITATLTASPLTIPPTGTYTFTVDGVVQKPAVTISATGTATITQTLPVGIHVVSATYSGDFTYASSSQTTSFTVNKATTTTGLAAVPINTAGQLSLKFTATITVTNPTAASGETGTVTFYAGSVQVPGCIPTAVVAGVATCSTQQLTFASNVLTAVYSGDANFSGSTSDAVNTNGGDFALGYANGTFTVAQGGVGQAAFTIESLFGGAGTVVPTCSGLPENSTCRFLPNFPSITSGQTLGFAIQIFTNVDPGLASNEKHSGSRNGIMLAFILPAGFAFFFFRKRSLVGRVLVMVLALVVLNGLSGCSSGTLQTFSTKVTPAGTYPIMFTFTGKDGLSTTHSSSITLVVLPNN